MGTMTQEQFGKLKPSEVIRVALKDLERVEHNDLYQVDLGHWHKPIGSKCFVCLAGAVLAGTLGVHPASVSSPGMMNDCGAAQRLRMLSDFSLDSPRGALCSIGVDDSELVDRLPQVQPYDRDTDGFKSSLLLTADELEKAGL